MAQIRFGPSGLGGKEEATRNLEFYAQNGLKACEIAFTYGVYLDKKSAEKIGKRAKELDIKLSIHASYFVNLNSEEKAKVVATKKRILDCCEIGHYLSAGDSNNKVCIVFHPGYYSKDKTLALSIIEKRISEMMETIKEKGWNVVLCPELMGKINVFGSIDEISKIVKDTGCSCCLDFAHVLARYQGQNMFKEIKEAFADMKEWHCHFSGIIYTDKGEKQHRLIEKKEWINLLDFLRSISKEVTIICESPDPAGDSIKGLSIWKK